MTARRRHTETTRARVASETRYRAIVEDQSALIAVADTDGTLRSVNQAHAAHFGATVAEMVERNLLDFVNPADLEGVRSHLTEMLALHDVRTGVNRMLSADGIARWVSWVNRPITDGHHRTAGHQCAIGRQ